MCYYDKQILDTFRDTRTHTFANVNQINSYT